ncbi:hypothetical protein CP97_10715 [Aurantiacibacter atlanticus]|uniref:Uncharacterized protein n=2 Tax=Aurantiacibacter atlanticus TaxID=1648404 RepID=A0A0H4VYZ3_9SPHN|nr:hypothetical protein CP97_10715 [Aurantiacibacter atlanticus]
MRRHGHVAIVARVMFARNTFVLIAALSFGSSGAFAQDDATRSGAAQPSGGVQILPEDFQLPPSVDPSRPLPDEPVVRALPTPRATATQPAQEQTQPQPQPSSQQQDRREPEQTNAPRPQVATPQPAGSVPAQSQPSVESDSSASAPQPSVPPPEQISPSTAATNLTGQIAAPAETSPVQSSPVVAEQGDAGGWSVAFWMLPGILATIVAAFALVWFWRRKSEDMMVVVEKIEPYRPPPPLEKAPVAPVNAALKEPVVPSPTVPLRKVPPPPSASRQTDRIVPNPSGFVQIRASRPSQQKRPVQSNQSSVSGNPAQVVSRPMVTPEGFVTINPGQKRRPGGDS